MREAEKNSALGFYDWQKEDCWLASSMEGKRRPLELVEAGVVAAAVPSSTSLFFRRLALLLSDLALTLFSCYPLGIQALALDRLTLLFGGLELDLLCRQTLLFSGGADLF